MIQQQSGGGQMSLWSRHHQSCSTLLVDRVHSHPVIQQQLHHLSDSHKTNTIRVGPKHCTFLRCSLCHCTCQWLCFTALKRGVAPRLLPPSTAAPCSNKRLQTASRPLPAAAVKAGQTQKGINRHDDTIQSNEISPLKLYMRAYIWH